MIQSSLLYQEDKKAGRAGGQLKFGLLEKAAVCILPGTAQLCNVDLPQ